MKIDLATICSSVLVICCWPRLEAQFMNQTIELSEGWNGRFLEVEPALSSCESLVQEYPQIDSIWTYDNRFGGERAFDADEFCDIGTPGCMLKAEPVRIKNRWHVFSADHPGASNLFSLRGGRAYLIHVKDGAGAITWTVTGKPSPTNHWWVPNDFSLTGFILDPERAPFRMEQYFAGSTEAHLSNGGVFYRFTNKGELFRVDRTDTIVRGHAYFVYTQGASQYRGPVDVRAPGLDGVDFGTDLIEGTVELRNVDTRDRSIGFKVLESEDCKNGVANAGCARMEYYSPENQQWKEVVGVVGSAQTVTVLKQSSRKLRFRALRKTLSVATKTADGGGGGDDESSAYQGILQVSTVDDGITENIPLSMEVADHSGLWTGRVEVRYVRRLEREPPPVYIDGPDKGKAKRDPITNAPIPGDYTVPTNFPDPLTDAAPEVSFPLLFHVSRDSEKKKNTIRILRQVAVMSKKATRDNSDTPENEAAPARYVVLNRDGLAAGLIDQLGLSGGYLRDGRQMSFRRTSPVFTGDHVLAEDVVFDAKGTYTTTIEVKANDPRNPFLHRYHPDHGHPTLMPNREGNVPAQGGLPIRRIITLVFDGVTDPRTIDSVEVNGVVVRDREEPGYGNQVVGGIYREIIESMTYDPIIVQGTFRVHMSARVPVLNDGVRI